MANGFLKRVEAFGQNIAVKVQTTTDIVSINNDIASKQRQIDELYADIGEAYVKAHATDEAPEFPEQLSRVLRLQNAVDELHAAVQRMKGYRQCPSCEAFVDADAAFCPRCGAAMPAEPQPEAEQPEAAEQQEAAEPHCAACGEALAEDAAFCTVCGQKRE